MSVMARVLTQAGVEVSACDLHPGWITKRLSGFGVTVMEGHDPSHSAGCDAIVHTAAVPSDAEELKAAAAAGVAVIPRGEALGMMLASFRQIAISGTHGKTTTSAMTASIFEAAGKDPTFLVGSDMGGLPGGRLGSSDLAIVEADEAFGSFLHLSPDIAVVTNIEADHLDFYGGMEALREAFRRFLSSGRVRVVNLDHAETANLAAEFRAITFGINEKADVRGIDVVGESAGSRFTLEIGDEVVCEVRVAVPGHYNVQNALAAAAAAHAFGISPLYIKEGLEKFSGTARRFERKGTFQGGVVFDDYAHHPTEVAAVLEAAQQAGWERVIAVFQPHLYSRTAALAEQFGTALRFADVAIVTEIYGSRELPVEGVDGKLVVDALCENYPSKRVLFAPTLSDAATMLASLVRDGDAVVCMGAGDITELPDMLPVVH